MNIDYKQGIWACRRQHKMASIEGLILQLSLRMLKNTLLEAVHAAAGEIMRLTETSFKISNKEGINDLVTEVDHAAEKAIIEVIKRNNPDHNILTEESGEIFQESDYKWIIDPIDGTVNFAHHIPICCVSVGIEHKGSMILGAVYNPFMNEFFLAEKGGGATLNNQKIQVSKKEKVERACLVTGFPYTYLDVENGPLAVFERMIRRGVPVRRLGSAAIDLCWVACGRFDGFYEHKLQPWDSAAGYLIVEEAGGRVTNLAGNTYSPYEPGCIATNGVIHDELIRWINNDIP
ncbi:MAG TPA: inositol monophosphatase family protein [Chitinophagaceae bacterium]|nr:inositol monophosphatase family protein [Chitinophagaceae bacterium]